MKPDKLLILAAALLITFYLTFAFNLGGVCAADQAVSKDELMTVYSKARQAVIDGDTEAFGQLVIPPSPDTPKATKQDLADAKVFIDEIFPELAKAKFHKFAQEGDEALFVVQTLLEDKENVNLNAFRFKKQAGRWMVWANFVGKSFSRENPRADEEKIKNTLEHNPDFKLESQAASQKQETDAAQAGEASFGQTGSGYLKVAEQNYQFGHAFAFRKKALGYEDKFNLHVVLTEKPVPVHKVQAQLREKDDWSAFVNRLTLVYDPELNPEYCNFWVRKDSTNFSGPPFYAKGWAKLEGGRIKGSLKMEKPKKLFGDSYIYEVSFNAPIILK
jgi:hypothetical protein